MKQSKLSLLQQLIVEDKRHALHPLDDYVEYCASIGACVRTEQVDSIPLPTAMIDFFEQKFVQEMEPLAKIASTFCRDQPGVKVQFVKNDPPDGRIVFSNGSEIGVECMSTRNDRLIKFAREQARRGVPTSTSGHTVEEIQGSKHKGYVMTGYAIKSEELCTKHQKSVDLICDRLSAKIPKIRNAHWLSVFIDEFELPKPYPAKLQLLQSVVSKFSKQLIEKGLTDVFFVGNKNWLTRHGLSAKYSKMQDL